MISVNVREFTAYVREFGSAALFAMFVFSTLFFANYVLRAWRDQGPTRKWRAFYTYENKAAIAWLTCSLGETIRSGMAILVLHWQNAGTGAHSLWVATLYAVGALVSLWGLICLLRALSRYAWPRYRWLLLVLMALLFGAVFVAM